MRTRILVTVKTYPTLSNKYKELVCTAGVREDGSWVRIYPVPFRSLREYQQYQKYHWIELDLERNTRDPRPETYRPSDIGNLTVGERVKTDGNAWEARRRLVLRDVRVDLSELIAKAKDPAVGTSLAVFKPARVLDFSWKPVEREWHPDKLQAACQECLFDPTQNSLNPVRKLPYKFSYTIQDVHGRKSTMMIEDWEVGMLYWNCLARGVSERQACGAVRQRYFDDFALKKDLHLFLGTTIENHFRAPNPFIIIGTFHPAHSVQTHLELG